MSVCPITRKTIVIVSALAAISTTTFAAPFNNLLGRDWRHFSGKDIQLLRKSLHEVLDALVVGATATWEDPETGEAGRVSIMRLYELNGMPCAEVEHVFMTHNRYRYVMPFCRKDGEWKMAF